MTIPRNDACSYDDTTITPSSLSIIADALIRSERNAKSESGV